MKEVGSKRDWFMDFAPKEEEATFKKLKEGASAPKMQKLRRVALEEKLKPRSISEMVEQLTPKQVAAYLKCSLDHVYDLVREGELLCQPDQSRIIIPVDSLHDYLNSQRRKRYG